MSARKYRHADGIGFKRMARTHEALTPAELATWITEQIKDDAYEVLVSAGVYVEWYSPMTEEEREEDDKRKARIEASTERYERETYERLREKFDPCPACNAPVNAGYVDHNHEVY
jgi:hypothetical protein